MRMPAARAKPKSKASEALTAFASVNKRETYVIGPVERYLLSRTVADPDRRQDIIHCSEMSKESWCHRATYYRCSGAVPFVEEKLPSMRLELIYEEGSAIHAKWQSWLWDAGVLQGMYECLGCTNTWWGEAPVECPRCQKSRKYLRYNEVPIESEEHHLVGHADLDVGNSLGEIKSIGIGTVRVEAPNILAKNTHEVEVADGRTKKLVDLEGVWRDIKRPFGSHVKQGMLYCHFRGHKRISVIYECKWNQANREFVVRYQPEYVEKLLDACLDIKYALKKGSPPPCPISVDGCPECKRYEEDPSASSRGDGGPDDTVVDIGTKRTGPPRRRRVGTAERTVERDAQPRRLGVVGDARPGPDEPPRPVHSLGRLLERTGRSSGDQREAS